MLYIKVNNDNTVEYPYSLGHLKRDFPNVSFPIEKDSVENNLSEFGIFQVKEKNKPEIDEYKSKLVEDNPEFYNNEWIQKYVIIDRTPEDQRDYKDSIIMLIVQDTKHHLDFFAQTRGYDSILSACTYATSNIAKFAAEGQYCIEARDLTWSKLYLILDEIETGNRTMVKHFNEIKDELPTLVWPVN
jgi:hypothetical protein